jgi:L,D-transpeptidase YcbB
LFNHQIGFNNFNGTHIAFKGKNKHTPMNSYRPLFTRSLYLSVLIAFFLSACKKPHSDIGAVMFKATKNKVYKSITAEQYTAALKTALNDGSIHTTNPKFINAYYESAEYEPVFIKDHFENGQIDSAVALIGQSEKHGLKPGIFQAEEIHNLLTKLKAKNGVKTADEACKDIAKLEVMLANSLINYSNAMEFGIISPRKIYARYFTKTLRPDSASMLRVFQAKSLKSHLDSIQPKNPQYAALQKALMEGYTAPGMTKEETQRILVVNLERLRWKNKPNAKKYVMVNIPAFQLDVMENNHSTLNMKVCVGEGRNKDYTETLTEYDESDKVDRPFSRETPQLSSMIYEAQVNPVWNIPESIATKEVAVAAAQDPYYLSNHNMDVYKNGQKIEDTETIDWGNSAEVAQYSFKQRPGEANALGRVKFLFENKSSVYLHDTPQKNAFNNDMRAVSHGCVRLERPLDLARALFGDGSKFKTIEQYMSEDREKPTDIGLSPKVPVYLTYITCWLDEGGKLQFKPDVYGLDIVLYGHMHKFSAA